MKYFLPLILILLSTNAYAEGSRYGQMTDRQRHIYTTNYTVVVVDANNNLNTFYVKSHVQNFKVVKRPNGQIRITGSITKTYNTLAEFQDRLQMMFANHPRRANQTTAYKFRECRIPLQHIPIFDPLTEEFGENETTEPIHGVGNCLRTDYRMSNIKNVFNRIVMGMEE